MRNTILTIITAVLFSFITVTSSYAADPAIDTNIFHNLMGLKCGDGNNPMANKCCLPPYVTVNLQSGSKIVDGWVLNYVNAGANALLGTFTSSLNAARSTLLNGVGGDHNICMVGQQSTPLTGDPIKDKTLNCTCLPSDRTVLYNLRPLCEKIKNTQEQQNCIACILGDNPTKRAGVWTGLGCFYTDLPTFIQNTLLGWGIGLAGFASTVCIIYGAFMMQISRGNAEKIKKAQELITSCITGLLLIIFSVFILRVIGVDILRLPFFK